MRSMTVDGYTRHLLTTTMDTPTNIGILPLYYSIQESMESPKHDGRDPQRALTDTFLSYLQKRYPPLYQIVIQEYQNLPAMSDPSTDMFHTSQDSFNPKFIHQAVHKINKMAMLLPPTPTCIYQTDRQPDTQLHRQHHQYAPISAFTGFQPIDEPTFKP